MPIVFLDPQWLLLLIAVPLCWFFPRRSTDAAHAALRSLALLFLALAAARPVLPQEDEESWQVIVLDRSPSLSAAGESEGRDATKALLERLDGEGRVLLLEFGAKERLTLPDAAKGRMAEHRRLGDGAGGSSLSTALGEALAWIPSGSRGGITLLSDGHATDPRLGAMIGRASERGIPIHTASLSAGDDPRLVGLRPLGEFRRGSEGRLLVRLRGSAASVRVKLLDAEGVLATSAAAPLEGERSLILEVDAARTLTTASGIVSLKAELEVLEGKNRRREDDVLETSIAIQKPPRALYLGHRIEKSERSFADLLGPNVEVVAAGDPLPMDFGAFDLVVLDDRPAETVPAPVQNALVEAVRDDGLGLAFLGGRGAFGPGGWHETPLASVLPVEAVQKEEKRDPSTTLVVIIDTSGSMGGSRVQLAKEVARLAIRRLLPHDKVGIVEFYGAKRWAAPIQPASNAIDLQRALNRLDAGGGTVIMPAIEEAFYGLQNVQTRYKHVLVLTDGGVEAGAFEPLVRRMSSRGIAVSTVLIGPQAHSEFLVSIANWGKGRFYNVPNRFNLPEILIKQPTSARLPAWRPGPHPLRARGGRSWWGDAAEREVPALDGFVETHARNGARVLLETRKGGHPVLATWSWGAGRVLAFTSEPTGAGTASWGQWEDYGRSFARVLLRCARDARPFEAEAWREDDEVVVRVRRTDGGDRLCDLQLGAGAQARLSPRARGVSEARIPWAPKKAARLEVSEGVHTKLLVVDPFADRSPELQVDRPVDLEAVAQTTGGKALALSSLETPSANRRAGERGRTLFPLWPLLSILALLSYLGDVAWRRWPREKTETADSSREAIA